MIENFRTKIIGKELKVFTWFSVVLLLGTAFILASPLEIFEGMITIVRSKDALITDYFKLAGYGASFFNAGFILMIDIIMISCVKLPFTGITMAACFINVCYGFWGKNPVNMMPIMIGTFLYAKIHKVPLGRYLYTALFGACLGPIVTELIYILPFSYYPNLLLTIIIGIMIGLMLPPISAHTVSMHMGYNLFNIGFSAGILAFGIACVMRSLAIDVAPVFIWQEGVHLGITIGVYVYLILTFLYGLWINKGNIGKLKKLMKHQGRAVTDFILMDGPGTTLMNMSFVGLISETYILLIGGDLSGPVQGAVFMAFGFAAFGAHVKNYVPVLLGVFLSNFITQYTPVTPGIQIAALFAVGLAPIAGQFGVIAGIAAGGLHAMIVMYTSQMYGGLNLYNNGFSAGWVAIIMVPLIESFMQKFRSTRRLKK